MKDRLVKLKEITNRPDKTMYFAAIFAERLKGQGIKPILVGGGALEFYTQGSYTTLDVNMVVAGREHAKKVLEEMGFHRMRGQRSWYNEELELSVEIPDDVLAGSMDRVVSVDMGGGLTAYVIGVEDLIIDRLNAYKYWKSLNDGEWAAATLAIHFDEIDLEYLKVRAEEEGTFEALYETLVKAEKLNKSKLQEKKKR